MRKSEIDFVISSLKGEINQSFDVVKMPGFLQAEYNEFSDSFIDKIIELLRDQLTIIEATRDMKYAAIDILSKNATTSFEVGQNEDFYTNENENLKIFEADNDIIDSPTETAIEERVASHGDWTIYGGEIIIN